MRVQTETPCLHLRECNLLDQGLVFHRGGGSTVIKLIPDVYTLDNDWWMDIEGMSIRLPSDSLRSEFMWSWQGQVNSHLVRCPKFSCYNLDGPCMGTPTPPPKSSSGSHPEKASIHTMTLNALALLYLVRFMLWNYVTTNKAKAKQKELMKGIHEGSHGDWHTYINISYYYYYLSLYACNETFMLDK